MSGEERIEQRLALDRVDVLALARSIDVLEQGELVHPHLQPTRGRVVAKTLHEQAQHLVHIDEHEGASRGQTEALKKRRDNGQGCGQSASGG